MPALNPYTFPLVPLADLPPEQARRSGMGGWEPYGLAAPSDRLLPFVLARRYVSSNAAWVNCAWIINELTGQKVAVLVPTASQAGVPVPTLGLVLTKMAADGNEYFTYTGALIPGLTDALAEGGAGCGTPLRLVVDNLYQSPLFYAVGPAAELGSRYLQLDWFHSGPLAGVPYGRGFRQRLYILNGAAQWNKPVETEAAQKDANTGREVQLSYAAYQQRTATLEPAPAYLVDALTLAKGHDTVLADGEPWEVQEVAGTPQGPDGGRVSAVVTLQAKEPFLVRGCPAAPLAVGAYNPTTDAPRGWRCDDPSDTAPDLRPTGSYTCELANGANTGNAVVEYEDINPNSATYQQKSYQTVPDSRCPVARLYLSNAASATATRNNCPSGQVGGSATYTIPAGQFSSTISKADANQKAQAAADAGAQAYANQNGSCGGRSVEVAGTQIVNSNSTVIVFLTRSDTSGDVTVKVRVVATTQDQNGGQPVSTTAFAYVTIFGGNDQASGEATFGSDEIQQVTEARIVSTTPNDYLF